MTPHFKAFLLLVAFLLMCAFWWIAWDAFITIEPKPPRRGTDMTQDWRPDIRHCHDEQETRPLWDCIRNVQPTT